MISMMTKMKEQQPLTAHPLTPHLMICHCDHVPVPLNHEIESETAKNFENDEIENDCDDLRDPFQLKHLQILIQIQSLCGHGTHRVRVHFENERKRNLHPLSSLHLHLLSSLRVDVDCHCRPQSRIQSEWIPGIPNGFGLHRVAVSVSPSLPRHRLKRNLNDPDTLPISDLVILPLHRHRIYRDRIPLHRRLHSLSDSH